MQSRISEPVRYSGDAPLAVRKETGTLVPGFEKQASNRKLKMLEGVRGSFSSKA